jgi:diguanylate cyclase (GGDEF)-like protein/PAS domain S-box-containing protein/excisionase family DNA binding protein
MLGAHAMQATGAISTAVAEQDSERFRRAFEQSPLGVALVDVELADPWRVTEANLAFGSILGRAETTLVGLRFVDVAGWDDHKALHDALEAVRTGTVERYSGEHSLIRGDGRAAACTITVSGVRDATGAMLYLIVSVEDLTERRAAQRELEASETRYRRILETANEGLWIIDDAGRTAFVNDKMAELLGYADGEMLGQRYESFLWPLSDGKAQQLLGRPRAGSTGSVDIQLQRRDGKSLWTLMSRTPLYEDDRFTGLLVMVSDISERKRAEEHIATLAVRDVLTGLPNRTLLRDRLGHALEAATRRGGLVGLYVLDLDRFKAVNDGFGHAAGDDLLLALVPRLNAAIGSSDTLARFGGDAFVVLCEDVGGELEAAHLATRLQLALAAPVELADGSFSISASIGVALSAGSAMTAEELLRDANTAMHRAKESGGNQHEIFDASMRARVLSEIALERDLRGALESDQLFLEYQPKVGLPEENLVGVEALLRWDHPDRGRIGPDEFIPLAERTGLILELGRWVLERACGQVAAWIADGDAPWARVAVNVSASQLDQPDFVDTVRAIVERSGIGPQRLELEITETALFNQDSDVTAATLRALDDYGISVVLDDFGTGYSSLGYLTRFPISGIKLDRAFISDFDPADHSKRSIIEAVTAMAQSLGLTMVGEGVETVEQGSLLAALGCEFAQGYLFSRPLPADELPGWIDTQRKHLNETVRLFAPEPSGGWVTLGEAASALGVSASTLRRWADSGRIASQRTSGGHRRFAVADLKRLGRASSRPRLDLGSGSTSPVPRLAAILESDGTRLLVAVTAGLYEKPSRGWFRSDRARRPMAQWISALRRACASGDYAPLQDETVQLARRAEIGGASLLEFTLFMERISGAMVQMLRRDGGSTDSEIVAAQRMLAAQRHGVLAER